MRHRKTSLLPLLFSGLFLSSPLVQSKAIDLMNFGASRSLYVDSSGKTQANWLNDQRTRFRCVFGENKPQYYCGVDISFGDGKQQGIDYGEFDRLELVIDYQGEATLLRFASRQALPGYESETYGVRWDYNVALHPGRNVFEIPLREFIVPPWWLASHSMPEDLMTPKWKNVVHIGFEIPSKSKPGEHIINIESFSVNRSSASPVAPLVALSGLLVLVLLGLILVYQRKRDRRPHDNQQRRRDVFLEHLQDLEKQQQECTDISEATSYDAGTLLLTRNAALSLLNAFSQQHSLAGIGIALFEVDNLDAICADQEEDLRYEIHVRVGTFLNVNTQPYEIITAWTDNSYALISPDAGLDRTKKIAAKICQQIKQLTFLDTRLSISLSAGIVNVADSETILEAFGRAESALLKAQDEGGDTFCVLDIDNRKG